MSGIGVRTSRFLTAAHLQNELPLRGNAREAQSSYRRLRVEFVCAIMSNNTKKGMPEQRIFLYVAPEPDSPESPPINEADLDAARAIIARKGAVIVDEVVSPMPDWDCFEWLMDRVGRGEASGVLRLNPQYLGDLPRIESLLDAHLGRFLGAEAFPWEDGHFMLSRRTPGGQDERWITWMFKLPKGRA
jgi:hypothetical protein